MKIYTEGGQRITKAMLDNLENEPEVKVKEKSEDPMAPIERFIAKHPDVANTDKFKNGLAKFLGSNPGAKSFAYTMFAVTWHRHADAMKGGA